MLLRAIALVALAATTGFADEARLALLDVTVGDFATTLLLPEGFQFRPGMPIYLTFSVGGYSIHPETNIVDLRYTVDAVDCLGQPFAPPVTRRYSHRFPLEEVVPPPTIRTSFTIPEYIYPGEGRFRITVTDLATQATVRQEVAFDLGTDYPAPSGSFEILDLRVYHAADDGTPAPSEVFRAGQTLSVRFLLAGFAWRENANEYDLRYGLAVLGANGRVLMNVPQAAAESNKSAYRKAFVPAVASVQLERTIRPGQYQLVVTAEDGVRGKKATGVVRFRVE